MRFTEWWDRREANRARQRKYVGSLDDETLIAALKHGETLLPIKDNGELFDRIDSRDWETVDALTREVSDRFENRTDTPRDMLLVAWADALYRALRTSWIDHRENVLQWGRARAELMLCDIEAQGAEDRCAIETTLLTHWSASDYDPIDDYPDVEGGYIWHRNRPPEPVSQP